MCREINLTRHDSKFLQVSNNRDRDLFVLKVPKESDFIVRFMSNSARTAFVGQFHNHINQSGKHLDVKEDNETVILENALTAERRAKAIESFLKAAFKNLVTGNTGLPRHEDLVDYVQHGDLKLTRTELAEIFERSSSSILSSHFFDVCDMDKNGLCMPKTLR